MLKHENSRIIKIRRICWRSSSLYHTRHQTSLKTGVHSGRWNLVIPLTAGAIVLGALQAQTHNARTNLSEPLKKKIAGQGKFAGERPIYT
jgi:hypothetical protein